MKRCTICKLDKEVSKFGKNRTKVDGLQNYCVSCQKEKDRKYYQKNKPRVRAKRQTVVEGIRQYIYEYLLEHPCVDCGEVDPVVLEFDHVRGKKKDVVSRLLYNRSFKTVINEIKKCDVRCSNCHKRKTAKEFGWYASVAQHGQST